MHDLRLPRLLYTLLFLAGLLLVAYYYPHMPLRVASHFAADGRPNGWMRREPFFLVMLLAAAFSGIPGFLIPNLIATRPDARINLPNKDYWLAAERRAATFGFISAMMAWFSCAVLFVLVTGTILAMRANLAPGKRFNSEAMLAVLAAFLFFVMAWFIRFLRYFQRTSPSP